MPLQEVDTDGLLVRVGEVPLAEGHVVYGRYNVLCMIEDTYVSYIYLAEALNQRRLSYAPVPHHNHLRVATLIYHCASKRTPPVMGICIIDRYCLYHLHDAFKIILNGSREFFNENHLSRYSLCLQKTFLNLQENSRKRQV